MSYLRKPISFLIILSFIAFYNYVEAVWNLPAFTQRPPISGIPPAINVGSIPQRKAGNIKVVNLTINSGGQFRRISIGNAVASQGGLRASGSIMAGTFCLGSTPSPDGCITNWQQGLSLSGGQPNSLIRWLTSSVAGNQGTISNSSISESGSNINVGRGVNITGSLNVDNGARLMPAVKLLKLVGASTANLAKKNLILSVDSLGKVVLVNADCTP